MNYFKYQLSSWIGKVVRVKIYFKYKCSTVDEIIFSCETVGEIQMKVTALLKERGATYIGSEVVEAAGL